MTGLRRRFSVVSMATVADEWNVLRRYSLDCIAADGSHSVECREVVHRPDTAAVLLYSRSRAAVLLIAQARLAVVLAGGGDRFLEAPSGIIDAKETPQEAAFREVYEETGYRISSAQFVGAFFLSPALSTERAHLFLADLDLAGSEQTTPDNRDVLGELESLEIPIDEAIALCGNGGVADAKTALLIGVAAAQFALERDPPFKPTRHREMCR